MHCCPHQMTLHRIGNCVAIAIAVVASGCVQLDSYADVWCKDKRFAKDKSREINAYLKSNPNVQPMVRNAMLTGCLVVGMTREQAYLVLDCPLEELEDTTVLIGRPYSTAMQSHYLYFRCPMGELRGLNELRAIVRRGTRPYLF